MSAVFGKTSSISLTTFSDDNKLLKVAEFFEEKVMQVNMRKNIFLNMIPFHNVDILIKDD